MNCNKSNETRKENIMHISFVVLHYLTIEDTKECINSIVNNLSYTNYSIVIVDNASNNRTVEELVKLYKERKNIHIIINRENLGFAKGNNVGFMYAKNELKADFVVMINNDTLILQKDFGEKIIETYEEKKFHVSGPNVVSTLDNKSQNPIRRQLYNLKQVKSRRLRLKILLLLSYVHLDEFFQKVYLMKKKSKNSNLEKSEIEPLEPSDYQLHGCCLIFSPLYISRYDGLYEGTFMYAEEDILRYICDRDFLNMAYIKELNIYHKEYSSTYTLLGKGVKKRRFCYKNSINSYGELEKLMGNK